MIHLKQVKINNPNAVFVIPPKKIVREKMRSRILLTIRSRRCLSRKEAIQVLGLEKNFEKSELKSVYLEKAKLYHPDKSDSNPEYFEKIKEAYEFLENEKPQGNFQF